MQREELSGTGTNLKRVSGDEYFRFVISGIETETVSFRGDSEFDRKIRLIRQLKTSSNLLKDIFLISKVKKSELLATYLLFILKKIEENQITFENLIENYESDKEFIKKELVSQVKMKYEPPKEQPKIIRPLNPGFTQTLTPNETLQNEFLSGSDSDNEPIPQSDESIISEEAEHGIHINIENEEGGQDEPVMANITSLELVSHENEEEAETEKEVFSIPENNPINDAGQGRKVIENPAEQMTGENYDDMSDVFETSKESESDTGTKEAEGVNADAADEVMKEEYRKDSKKEKFHIKEKVEKLKKLFKKPDKDKTEIIPEAAPEEDIVIKPAAVAEEPAIVIKPAETIPEEPRAPQDAELTPPQEDETAAEPPAESSEPKRIQINPITEQYESVIPDEPSIHISEAEPDPEEIRFMEYLEKVIQTNTILKNEIGQHTDHINRNTVAAVYKNSLYLKEYSEEMSFEIITEIYYTISLYFDFYGKQDAMPETFETDKAVMLATLEFVEVFINGGEYNGSETLIKDIEAIKGRILDIKAEQERLEKLQKEKAELEKQLGEKFADTEQRKKLLTLKSNILEVESIFKSIDSINGEFQTYEAFRILSQTYSVFKSIVTQSNALEIEKMASLAESSYIFLKYIQNYRMNPFSEDIKEVLKYIIVNFKLLFLGKPTKDLDVFISYLNNPEKIFTQKEEPNDE
jgi:hypothetical protein